MKEIKKVKTAVIILLIFSFLNMVSKSVKIIAVGIEKDITYKVLKEKRSFNVKILKINSINII